MKIDEIESAIFFAAVKIRNANYTYANVNDKQFLDIRLFYNHDIRQLAILDPRAGEGNYYKPVTLVGAENIPQMHPISSSGWWNVLTETQSMPDKKSIRMPKEMKGTA